VRAGIVEITNDHRIRFCHPLIRSAAYAQADLTRRRTAHAALAAVLPDESSCRAWHLAAAATGPDETVAAMLEKAAEGSRRRGGYLEVARALQRAAELSPAAEAAARRYALAAAAANFDTS